MSYRVTIVATHYAYVQNIYFDLKMCGRSRGSTDVSDQRGGNVATTLHTLAPLSWGICYTYMLPYAQCIARSADAPSQRSSLDRTPTGLKRLYGNTLELVDNPCSPVDIFIEFMYVAPLVVFLQYHPPSPS